MTRRFVELDKYELCVWTSVRSCFTRLKRKSQDEVSPAWKQQIAIRGWKKGDTGRITRDEKSVESVKGSRSPGFSSSVAFNAEFFRFEDRSCEMSRPLSKDFQEYPMQRLEIYESKSDKFLSLVHSSPIF